MPVANMFMERLLRMLLYQQPGARCTCLAMPALGASVVVLIRPLCKLIANSELVGLSTVSTIQDPLLMLAVLSTKSFVSPRLAAYMIPPDALSAESNMKLLAVHHNQETTTQLLRLVGCTMYKCILEQVKTSAAIVCMITCQIGVLFEHNGVQSSSTLLHNKWLPAVSQFELVYGITQHGKPPSASPV